ncbi:MAG: alkaline phosphatase family protein [Bryobacteraceae bacterium]
MAAIALALSLAACGHPPPQAHGKRVIVLGVDGMDPGFVERHWGALPNLARLRNAGGLQRLATTTPPQSPVAWSTFITGTDPAAHGLFDFVHRDPATLQPFSSMAGIVTPAHQLAVGPYLLPLSSARVRSFRTGQPFWRLLAEHGIPVTVVCIPVNYPPAGYGHELAGMGTPDLEGTFGTFTWYTDDPSETAGDVPGGRVVQVERVGSRVTLPVEGPPNTLRGDHRPTGLEMTADVDPDQPAARFRIGGQMFILRQGEWSPWIRVRFPLVPHLAGVAAMFRLYARELQPGFRLYRSPLNADPAEPALPLSTPAGWSRELSGRLGPFYTQGIAEDTSAMRQGALTLPEYLEQSRLVSAERRVMLRDCLDHFEDGFLFFYFSEVDQNSHLLWGRHEAELLETYQSVDREIGGVLDRAAGATVMVMSDHGFAAFDYAVNLNTWLWREGFLALDNPASAGGAASFAHIDWGRSKAYAMGLNALYINLAGRERRGIVAPGAERDSVVADLVRRLGAFRDPATGQAVIAEISSPGKSASRFAPDLIVGYAPPYRASWLTAMGGISGTVIEPNRDAWIGDHCMAAASVPGVLLGTRRPRLIDPGLKDLSVTILKEFGIARPIALTGRAVY